MKLHLPIMLLLSFALGTFPAHGQTHNAVYVDHRIYYILENAELRGLIQPLPRVKPYSQRLVLQAIDEILTNGEEQLSETEKQILRDTAATLRPNTQTGLDWYRGLYHYSQPSPKKQVRWEGDVGMGFQVSGSGAISTEDGTFDWGANNRFSISATGDIGEQLTFRTQFVGFITRAPREILGTYHTYYPGFVDDIPQGNIDQELTIYSDPVAFFPYSYRKYWDGFIVFPDDVSSSSLANWPDRWAIAPHILGELSGSILDDMVYLRFSRMRREWGAISTGKSLIYNGSAQPFMAIETSFNPAYWFTFSSLTGVLEYFNDDGLKNPAKTFQSAFSIEQLELNYKNYISFDAGSTAIWAKRFELGYIFPNNNNFLYQSSIGDFDNMGFFVNLRGQFPGIFGLWISFFADEINPATLGSAEFWELDRNMYAGQVGFRALLPWLPFASLSLSYTKVEPYAYTHTRINLPWYDSEFNGKPSPMETSYINNGVPLGYFLPPNSDELQFRFEALATRNLDVSLQYQMIRHGADHGSQAVDGSNFLSELDPDGRDKKTVLRKFFLQDGAYQWQHSIKIGGEYSFKKYPFQIFGDFGFVFSYYTALSDPATANSGNAYSFTHINTAEYPQRSRLIASLGVRLWPWSFF